MNEYYIGINEEVNVGNSKWSISLYSNNPTEENYIPMVNEKEACKLYNIIKPIFDKLNKEK